MGHLYLAFGSMNIILKSIASWRILAPAIIAVMVTWLLISCVISVSFVRASGKVVRLVQKGSDADSYYCPVTIFRDAAGVEHTIQSSGGSNPPRFPVGSTVTVLYRTKNPDAGMIEDHVLLWIVPLVSIALGVFYGFIGTIVGRWLQRQETRNTASYEGK